MCISQKQAYRTIYDRLMNMKCDIEVVNSNDIVIIYFDPECISHDELMKVQDYINLKLTEVNYIFIPKYMNIESINLSSKDLELYKNTVIDYFDHLIANIINKE